VHVGGDGVASYARAMENHNMSVRPRVELERSFHDENSIYVEHRATGKQALVWGRSTTPPEGEHLPLPESLQPGGRALVVFIDNEHDLRTVLEAVRAAKGSHNYAGVWFKRVSRTQSGMNNGGAANTGTIRM
jgi:hypothetical protein